MEARETTRVSRTAERNSLDGARARPRALALAHVGVAERIGAPADRGAQQRAASQPGSRGRRGWFVRRALLVADVVGLLTAFAITEAIFYNRNEYVAMVGPWTESLIFVATLPGWIVAAKVYGLYDRDEARADHSTVDEFVSVFHLVTVVVWLFFAVSWVTGLEGPSQTKLATFWLLTIGLLAVGRSTARAVSRRRASYLQSTVIVGAGDVGQLVARKFRQHPEYGIDLLGFVDATPRELRGDLDGVRLLGAPDELAEIVSREGVERVVIAFSQEGHADLLGLVGSLRGLGVQIDVVPRLFESLGPKVDVHAVEGLPLVGLPPARLSRSSRALKRGLDVVGASLGLLLCAPLLAFVAIRIRLDSPGPVFFRQTRLGVNMRPFELLKFRTMRADADEAPHREYIERIMDPKAELGENRLYKLERQDAVTPVGRWLRRTSMDELPQLVNVLRGEMSLVGPRPCIPYETEVFDPHHFERFLVPAGLTGLWQVAARARSTFREALDLDVAYARSWSLGLDIRLLARTPLLLLRRSGTS